MSEDTRAKVARLARARGISQAAYVEEIVAEKAAAQWEGDFWAQMGAESFDDGDWADLHEQEAAFDADLDAAGE
ncbi:MAG: hypothetical protein J2O46_10710 [Nocardioides sp.]|nr:hypothetical protein [Nocardioides sp.]